MEMAFVAEFVFGMVEFSDDDEAFLFGDRCPNCGDEKHIPDDRTGLIHKHGKYTCFQEIVTSGGNVKRVPMETVAE